MDECYVIMPFRESYSELYASAIQPAVEEYFGAESCQRADRDKHLGIITDKIVHGIMNARMVVAVITGGNPNVMYELGLAHSLRKPTIMLIARDDGAKIPFDIGAQEAIFYQYDASLSTDDRQTQLRTIKDQVSEYIQAFSADKRTPTNPIAKALHGCRAFVDDLRSWLWGYTEVYERERRAKVIWEMTPNPHWVTRDPLFNEQITASISEERQKYYYLVPRSGPVLSEMNHFLRSLEETLGEQGSEKIKRWVKYVSIDPDFFELLPFSIVIYDACYGVQADAIICEPMAPEIGEDADYDNRLMELGVEGWDELTKVDRLRERYFDVRLAEQKVRILTWTFTTKWNEQIDAEIANASDAAEKRFLRDNWRL